MSKTRKCPYCDVTTFRFKKKDTKWVCAKCSGVVYNYDNPLTEEIESDIKKLQRDSDKSFKFISNFVEDYCNSEEDKEEFFKYLEAYVNFEIELEKECNK